MSSVAVIPPQPLARQAVIDMRPSTPPQALSPQESLRLQDALPARAPALGWAAEAMAVLDSEVGHRAASAQPREGCNTWGGQVTLGHVGIILS